MIRCVLMDHAATTKDNITLIGMAGVGKSTFGKRVAKTLGLQFIDIDTLIQESTGKPLQTLINENGESAFLDIEESVVLNLPPLSRTIISPGGSIIYCPKAMKKLKSISKIIYLQDSLHNIQVRIPNLRTRGIVGLGNKSLEELFNEREKLYRHYADTTLVLTGNSDKSIIDLLEKECI